MLAIFATTPNAKYTIHLYYQGGYIMQKVLKKRFIPALIVAVMMMALLGPATEVKASNEVTNFTGQIPAAKQTKTHTFRTGAPVAVKIGYGSISLYDDRSAPVTIYIDNVYFDRTDGVTTRTKIWSLTAGTHTIKVVNGDVPSIFSINIVNIAS